MLILYFQNVNPIGLGVYGGAYRSPRPLAVYNVPEGHLRKWLSQKKIENGDWHFQIYWIKIDHFRGLVGPLEGRGGARESKIEPKKGLKQALFGPFWVYT